MMFKKEKPVEEIATVEPKPERVHGSTREETPYPYGTESRSGSGDGYTVEARYVFPSPMVVGKQIFDNQWRTVHFSQGYPGVPTGGYMHREAASLGFMSYQAAQAMRWWFLAELEVGMSGLCMETRLVRHTVKYSITSEAVSAHDNLGGDKAEFDSRRPIDVQKARRA